MLTVKQVLDDGKESLRECERVQFSTSIVSGSSDSFARYGTLWAIQKDGAEATFQDGTVYVMNEAGATVGKYVLSTIPKGIAGTPPIFTEIAQPPSFKDN
jgi:hypothetical protein